MCLGLLAEIAESEPLALKDPAPVIMVENFGDSSIDFLFGVWGKTEEFFDLKTSLMIRIKETFDANNIEIPFPHLSLYAGEESKPIRITNEGSVNT